MCDFPVAGQNSPPRSTLGFVSFVLSLGPRLTVNGTSTGIPLPAILLTHVPLLDDMVWNRWGLFVTLFACVVLSIGLDRWFGYLRRLASSEHVRNRLSSANPPFNLERLPRFMPRPCPAPSRRHSIPLASAYPLASKADALAQPARELAAAVCSDRGGCSRPPLRHVIDERADGLASYRRNEVSHCRRLRNCTESCRGGYFHVAPTESLRFSISQFLEPAAHPGHQLDRASLCRSRMRGGSGGFERFLGQCRRSLAGRLASVASE